MNRKSLVNEAGARFHRNDEAGFLRCFDAGVRVYSEPDQPERSAVNSRDELAAMHSQIRSRFPHLELTLVDIEERGAGVLADAVIVIPADRDTEEGWRVVLAIGFADDLIGEVRAYWQRDAAIRVLEDL